MEGCGTAMKDKQRKRTYRKKQCIYNSLIAGNDAFDGCSPCVWYNEKHTNACTDKRCRYRPIKFRKVIMQKIKKYRKEYVEWEKNARMR